MAIEFWDDKEKNILKTDLLSDIAKGKAAEVYESRQRDNNKSSQIRKFFDEVIKYKTELLANPDDLSFKQKLPYIKMINAKLAYSQARGLISENCEKLFSECINKIQDKKDFFAFADFFEAFIAFYKKHNNK